MAQPSFIHALNGSLPQDIKRSQQQVWDYALANLRFGQPEAEERSENLQAYYYAATTPAVANTEFSIPHSLGRAPYLLIPVLPLNDVNAQIVPLTVSRAADSARIYLKSSATSAPIRVLVEG
jgi:hypothetical protein